MALRTFYPSAQLWKLVQSTVAQGHLINDDENAIAVRALLKTPVGDRGDDWRSDFAARIEAYVSLHAPEPPLKPHIAIVNDITEGDVIYVLQQSNTLVLKRDRNNFVPYLHTVEPVAALPLA